MNIFNTVKVKRPNYSTFDLSYDVKMSMKMGKLIPCHLQEVIPGDRYRIAQEAMFRMMPMIAPIMHKVDIYFHTFFVPNRILWPNWEKFITGGDDPGVPPALPTIDPGVVEASSLANYLGCPVSALAKSDGINALPFAAYQRIWYEFYRDQNMQTDPGLSLTDGAQSAPNETALKTLRNRAWEHDYFTSALPFAQKGAAVEIPFDGSGLSIEAISPTQTATGFNPQQRSSGNQTPYADSDPIPGALNTTRSNTNSFGSTTVDGPSAQFGSYYDPQGTLIVEGTGSTTVNDLRTAFSLQKWLEKNARAGTRYVESLLAHFGVRSSDARLQRPEYIGGSKASMAISEVLQTSSSDTTTPQGNMAGHGVSITAGGAATYRAEEHGYMMTLISIRPKTSYYNGIPRHFLKQDRMEYYWPDFAFLGEQPVFKGELLHLGVTANDRGTWGYLPRYSEYRYNMSRVCGQMATSLEFWHMGRKFNELDPLPPLNEDFIVCEPTKRIFAVDDPDEDEIVAHIYHKIVAQRPIPQYGTPGIY